MLLSLLTITAILIGGISFAATLSGWGYNSQKSTQPSVFPNRQVSLWSLILFLFFPTVSAPYEPKPDRSWKQLERAILSRKVAPIFLRLLIREDLIWEQETML